MDANRHNDRFLQFDNIDPLDFPPLQPHSTPGRRRYLFTAKLSLFLTSTNKHPKKEFFNAFIIRAVKRALRHASNGRTPRFTSIQVDISNPEVVGLWTSIQDIYSRNPAEIEKLAKTDSGPITEGRTIRTNTEGVPRSFNNEYCRNFFSNPLMQRVFRLIIQIMTMERNAGELCKIFKFRCCEGSHNVFCIEKWLSLKEYLLEKYLDMITMGDKHDEPTENNEVNSDGGNNNLYASTETNGNFEDIQLEADDFLFQE
jgi:hypothetical protein